MTNPTNLPSQHEAEWAERDSKSFRDACKRVDNPWKMVIPPEMPQPAMDAQELQWGENICGLWSYRRYLAINGKWVDMDPTRISCHPFGIRKLE